MTKYAALLLCTGAVALAGPALASGPPQTVPLGPIVFTDVNPCTNAPQVVTLTATLRAHDFELADPARHHGNSTVAGTITTSSGYSGRITEVAVDNGAGLFDEEEDRGMLTLVSNGIARDESGDAFAVHFLLHVTLVDGEPVAVVERFRLECLGEGGQ
jgi:hypothetical protein